MSFEGKISGSLAPQGARVGSISGNIGTVVPDIRDESVTTAKLADEAVTTAKIADAAVTIAKLAQDVTALINSKGDASDVATLQSDVAALQTITEGLGTASTYGVANNLTQSASGVNVLDAAQGKALGDRLTTAEGNITTLNDGYTKLSQTKTIVNGGGNMNPVRTLAAQSGTSFKSLFGSNIELSIPTGYVLERNIAVWISGYVGLSLSFDYPANTTSTSINPFVFNGSPAQLGTSTSLQYYVISIVKKA